jgi:hypothetical protein
MFNSSFVPSFMAPVQPEESVDMLGDTNLDEDIAMGSDM